jgi:hypothetical protein
LLPSSFWLVRSFLQTLRLVITAGIILFAITDGSSNLI